MDVDVDWIWGDLNRRRCLLDGFFGSRRDHEFITLSQFSSLSSSDATATLTVVDGGYIPLVCRQPTV